MHLNGPVNPATGYVWMDTMLYRNILSNNIFLRLSASIEQAEYMHTNLCTDMARCFQALARDQ